MCFKPKLEIVTIAVVVCFDTLHTPCETNDLKFRESHEHNSNSRYRRFPCVHFTRLRFSSNSFRRLDELQRRRNAGCLFES